MLHRSGGDLYVDFDWSPSVATEDEPISLGNLFDLLESSHDLDRARRHWNKNLSFKPAQFALGDVDRDGVIEGSDVSVCQQVVNSTLRGDFDQDGDIDDHDIDVLFIEVAAHTHSSFYDLTDDSLVDAADATRLVEGILHTHFGDANLDGRVDRTDAAIVTTNFGRTAGATWAKGNFNGDAAINLVDLAIEQTYFGTNSAPSPAAPSPAAPRAIVAIDNLPRFRPIHTLVAASRIRAIRQTSSMTRTAELGHSSQTFSDNLILNAGIRAARSVERRRPRNASRSPRQLAPKEQPADGF